MTKNGKKANKYSLNGYAKKVNGSLYILMEEEMKMTKGMEN